MGPSIMKKLEEYKVSDKNQQVTVINVPLFLRPAK